MTNPKSFIAAHRLFTERKHLSQSNIQNNLSLNDTKFDSDSRGGQVKFLRGPQRPTVVLAPADPAHHQLNLCYLR